MNKKIRLKRRKNSHLQKTANHFVRIGRLLEQGYPLNAALTFIQLHVSNPTKKQISDVLESLKSGHPAYEAFHLFDIPPSLKSFLYFYEQQGELAEGFIRAGTLLEQREKMKQELVKILRYPILLLWFCLLLLVLMYQFVVPHFRSFFTTMTEIPLLTKLLLIFLQYSPYFFLMIFVFLFIGLLYYWYKMKSWSPYKRVMKLLSLPFLSKYVQTIITYYFSLQLGRMLGVGMTLQQALHLFNRQDYLPFFQQECTHLSHELHQGHSLARLIHDRIYYREELSFVIENGEKTGYLANDLVHYSEILFRELDESFQRALRFIQPTFFIMVGGVVFLLFLATMLPLFQMVGVL